MDENKPIELENGDKLVLKSRLNGADYLKFKATLANMISQLKKERGDTELQSGDYIGMTMRCFSLFVESITQPDGTKIPPTYEYYENLSFSDADTVFKIIDHMSTGLKKTKVT